MAIQSIANGILSAVVGPDAQTMTTQTGAGVYVLKVDLSEMIAGDVVTLSIKAKCRAESSLQLAYSADFAGQQTEPLKYSVPVPIEEGSTIVCTLQQSAGSARNYHWNLLVM